jgi:TorA maturation chaperone TorD
MSCVDKTASQKSMTADRSAIAAHQRAGVYELLASLFHRPLSDEILRGLRAPPLLGALAAAGVDLDREFLERPETTLQDELAVDFTQLFHGPRGHVVPYESVQTGSEGAGLDGPAASAVRQFLGSEGLELGVYELPDHVAVELALMAALAKAEAHAWNAEDPGEAERLRSRQRDFMTAHLGRWAPRFARAVAAKATTNFYREMAWLLADFVEAERLLLSESEILSDPRGASLPSRSVQLGVGHDPSPHGSRAVASVA